MTKNELIRDMTKMVSAPGVEFGSKLHCVILLQLLMHVGIYIGDKDIQNFINKMPPHYEK